MHYVFLADFRLLTTFSQSGYGTVDDCTPRAFLNTSLADEPITFGLRCHSG